MLEGYPCQISSPNIKTTLNPIGSIRAVMMRRSSESVLWFVSGNRDEAVFADPHRPRLDRNPNPNVAFGQGGPHFCLGMWLARLEVKVVLQVLADRLAGIEAVGPPRWTRSNFICGVKSLPVQVHVCCL